MIGNCVGEATFNMGYVAPSVSLLEHSDCHNSTDGGLQVKEHQCVHLSLSLSPMNLTLAMTYFAV